MEEATASSQLPDMSVISLEDEEGKKRSEGEMDCGADKEEKKNQHVVSPSIEFSHPVYKELAILNKKINKQSVPELRNSLKKHKLSIAGKRDVLCSRLKAHVRHEKLKELGLEADATTQRTFYYDYFLVIDFEATCDDDSSKQASYRHEIIEFPVLLVSTKKAQVIDEFHSHVKPLVNPRLTTFCTSLTAITQDMVNFAPTFPEVLKKFDTWLEGHELNSSRARVAVVTDGPWDMGRFLHQQCCISKVPYPSWGKKWINLKKTFSNFYDTKRLCLKDMLNHLGLGFQGQPHCGLDDSRNIARVAICLLRDGANLRVNEKIVLKNHRNTGECMVRNISRHNFNGMRKKLIAASDEDTIVASPNQRKESAVDSEGDGSEDGESEHVLLDTGDMNEFPELISTSKMINAQ